MKKSLLVLGVVSLFAAAQAQAETMVADTDGNGSYSMEELLVSFPELTAEVFAAADTDASGELSAEELKAAQAAGTIPA